MRLCREENNLKGSRRINSIGVRMEGVRSYERKSESRAEKAERSTVAKPQPKAENSEFENPESRRSTFGSKVRKVGAIAPQCPLGGTPNLEPTNVIRHGLIVREQSALIPLKILATCGDPPEELGK